ncbi:hypothetical protein [Bradyrhizobium sp. SYSU BS000235]|uniref:hypothetical protein n=1 Tax=Bradyrhizobium sp. SYSU BS000235 TaxID=3411332 RepID=UPI003C78FC9F
MNALWRIIRQAEGAIDSSRQPWPLSGLTIFYELLGSCLPGPCEYPSTFLSHGINYGILTLPRRSCILEFTRDQFRGVFTRNQTFCNPAFGKAVWIPLPADHVHNGPSNSGHDGNRGADSPAKCSAPQRVMAALRDRVAFECAGDGARCNAIQAGRQSSAGYTRVLSEQTSERDSLFCETCPRTDATGNFGTRSEPAIFLAGIIQQRILSCLGVTIGFRWTPGSSPNHFEGSHSASHDFIVRIHKQAVNELARISSSERDALGFPIINFLAGGHSILVQLHRMVRLFSQPCRKFLRHSPDLLWRRFRLVAGRDFAPAKIKY